MAERNTGFLEGDKVGRRPIAGVPNSTAGRKSAVTTVVAAAAVTFLAASYLIERAGFSDLPGEPGDYLAALVLTALVIGLVRREVVYG